MKMIEVLNMMAKGEIKEGAQLKIGGNVYSYIDTYIDDSGYCSFVNEEGYSDTFLEDEEMITQPFLNLDVELIQPKEKKYLVKVNIKGLIKELTVLNYQRLTGKIHLGSPGDTNFVKTSFTKSEMQSIEPIRAFLDDMKGKYTFIEVEE